MVGPAFITREMEANLIKYLWLIVLTLAQIVLVGFRILERRNHKKDIGNPVNLERFHQEFKDFKNTQEKWNDRIEKEIDELEKLRRPGK